MQLTWETFVVCTSMLHTQLAPGGRLSNVNSAPLLFHLVQHEVASRVQVVILSWLESSVSKHNRSRDRRMIGLDAVAVHSDVTLDMSDSLMFAFEATAEWRLMHQCTNEGQRTLQIVRLIMTHRQSVLIGYVTIWNCCGPFAASSNLYFRRMKRVLVVDSWVTMLKFVLLPSIRI